MRRNDRLVGSYSRQSVEIEFLAQLHECHPRKSFFLPDQRAGNSVWRLKPSIALSGSSKRRAQGRTLLAQQLLFRCGEFLEFIFTNFGIRQIEIV